MFNVIKKCSAMHSTIVPLLIKSLIHDMYTCIGRVNYYAQMKIFLLTKRFGAVVKRSTSVCWQLVPKSSVRFPRNSFQSHLFSKIILNSTLHLGQNCTFGYVAGH